MGVVLAVMMDLSRMVIYGADISGHSEAIGLPDSVNFIASTIRSFIISAAPM